MEERLDSRSILYVNDIVLVQAEPTHGEICHQRSITPVDKAFVLAWRRGWPDGRRPRADETT